MASRVGVLPVLGREVQPPKIIKTLKLTETQLHNAAAQAFRRRRQSRTRPPGPTALPELRRLARGYLRNERRGHTLQPTALVHEAYSRLVKQDEPDYRSRAHFMSVAAQVMRQILIDHARTRDAGKRGAGAAKVPSTSKGRSRCQRHRSDGCPMQALAVEPDDSARITSRRPARSDAKR